MSTRLTLLVVSLVAAASAGCSKDKDMAEDEFCPEYARIECTTVGERCAASTNDACLVARTSECQNRAVGWKSANRPFSPKNAEACLDRLKATYAMFEISVDNLRALEDACARVYQGSAMANAKCGVSNDCQGSLICDKGLCGEKRVVAAGGGCANAGEQCPTGQTCKPGAAPGPLVCQPRQTADMACSETEPCLESLRCDGTCIARLPISSACTQHADCALPSGYCDPYAKICARGLAFALGSASCQAFMSGSAAALEATSDR